MGGHDSFRTGGRLAIKINITFFGGIDVLNIFHLTIFLKKTIFSKITAKKKYNFFFYKWGTEYSFKVFSLKNPVPSDLNQKNWFRRHIFSNICGSIGPIVFKNNRVHPWVDPHQPCEFHWNRFKTAICIVRSHTHKYISILTLRICYQGPPKRKTWPPMLPLSEVDGIRKVVILFRNIDKIQSARFGRGRRRRSRIWIPFFFFSVVYWFLQNILIIFFIWRKYGPTSRGSTPGPNHS